MITYTDLLPNSLFVQSFDLIYDQIYATDIVW